MWCLQTILFVIVLCAEYLLGNIDSNTLNVLIDSVQKLDVDDVESDVSCISQLFHIFSIQHFNFQSQFALLQNIERNHDALKRHAIVNLPQYGLIQGSIGFSAWTERTIFQFLNVPYAESPSGNRRFKVLFDILAKIEIQVKCKLSIM